MQLNDTTTIRRVGVVVDLTAMSRCNRCQQPVVPRQPTYRPDGRTLIATLLLLCYALSEDHSTAAAAVTGEFIQFHIRQLHP